jgi:dTDP-4-dehydrorhamnose reductase
VKVYLTGASGFVGSNVARTFGARGEHLIAPGHEHVDLTDADAVARSVLATRPDAIVHCAILNDQARMEADRDAAWQAYVGATRNVVEAANGVGAHVVLVSTDWVFDGTQSQATEATPPNPINLYGFLKAASELVVTERADRGAIARISGVNGLHYAQVVGGRAGGIQVPRAQDAGFGYFVASLVDALRAGRRFTVWDDCRLNMHATPTLATDAADLIWRALERRATGILHCVGGEHSDRIALARRAVAVFDLDPDLLEVGPPDPGAVGTAGVPFDTRLDAAATADVLGVELPDLDSMLRRLRTELETCWSAT